MTPLHICLFALARFVPVGSTRRNALGLGLWLMLFSSGLLADTVTLTTVNGTGLGADAYVRGGSSATTNYGTSTSLETRGSGTTASTTYKVYLRFDLRNSGLDLAKATSVTLRFATTTAYTDVGFDFYALVDKTPADSPTSGWVESSINYNNAPGNTASSTDKGFLTAAPGDENGNYLTPSLGTLTGQTTGGGAQHSFSSTALLNAIKGDSNGVVTFALKRTDANSMVSIVSSESTSTTDLKPTLVIVAPRLASVATTQAASSITYQSATLNGTVNPNGSAATGSFRYSTDPTLTAGVLTTTGQALGGGTVAVPMTAIITGLLPHQTYYFQAQSTTASGTSQGGVLSFTTSNRSPVATNDQIGIPAGAGPFTLQVLGNDADPDGDTLTISAATNGTVGTATVQAGSLRYTPGASFAGSDRITYTVTDGFGGTSTATVTITGAPVVTTQSATSISAQGATLNASVNPRGTSTSGAFVISTSPTLAGGNTTSAQSLGNGTSTVALNAVVSGLLPHTTYYYQPSAANSAGTTEGTIASFSTANRAPSAANDQITVAEGSAGVTVAVLSNDIDADGDTLTLTVVGTPQYGTARISADTIIYTPGTRYSSSDSFTYTVSDGFGGTATATVNVTVSQVFYAPTATTLAASEVSATSTVLNAGINPGGVQTTVAFRYSTDASLSTGVATTNTQTIPAGSTDVAISAALSGLRPHTTYYFQATASNSVGSTQGGILSVRTPNRAPVAAAEDLSIGTGAGPFVLNVLSNDTDPDSDSLSVQSATNGAYGTVTTTLANVSYTPGPNYDGSDTFTYTVSDGFGGTATATVQVRTTYQPPVVTSQAATSVTVQAAVLNGTVNPGGTNGTGTFRYSIDSSLATGVQSTPLEPVAKSSAAVSLSAAISGLRAHTRYYFQVVGGNKAGSTNGSILNFVTANTTPVAVDDQSTVFPGAGPYVVDVLANDSDSDLDTLTITAVTNGVYGNVSRNGTTVSYTPGSNYPGSDSFTYTVSDGFGGTATARVSIVTDYDVPDVTTSTATNVTSVAATLNGVVNPGGLATTASFTYAKDAALSVSPVTTTEVSIGSGIVDVATSAQLTGLSPHTTYYFQANGTNQEGTASGVILSFFTLNRNPVAVSDAATVPVNGTPISISVLANDSDADSDPLSIASVTNGAFGSVAISGTKVTYTPDASYDGSDSFTYTVADGFGGTATGTVTVSTTYSAPSVTTTAATSVTHQSATLNGTVNAGGTAATGTFRYSTDINLQTGVTTTSSQSMGKGVSALVLNAPVSGLLPHTTYYFQTVGTNKSGTTLGTKLSFMTANRAPVAVADTFAIGVPGGAVTLSVLANDSDADGDTLTISATTNGAVGIVTKTATTVAYTPGASFKGIDTFTYTSSDGFGGTSTASVTVYGAPTVTTQAASSITHEGATLNARLNPNSSPASILFSYSTDASLTTGVVLTSAQVVASGTSLVAVNAPVSGLAPHTTYYYQPTAMNSGGTVQGSKLSFTTANRAPITASDSLDLPVGAGNARVDVFANDSDPDGDTLTLSTVTQGRSGSVTIAGNAVHYAPGAGYDGSDSFTYTADDGFGGATVGTVTVTTAYRAPEVTTMAVDTVQYESATLRGAIVAGGTTASASFRYGTDAGLTVGAQQTASVVIGRGLTAAPHVAEVTGLRPHTTYFYQAVGSNKAGSAAGDILSFTTGNRNPRANADSVEIPVGAGPYELDVLANDDDQDGDTVTLVDVSGATRGVATLVGGTIAYVPGSDYTGQDQLTYTIEDGFGGRAQATVSISTRYAVPTVTTGEVGSITHNSAVLGAVGNANGAATTVRFVYGKLANLADGAQSSIASIGRAVGEVNVSVTLASLAPHTTYFYRAVGNSTAGEGLGAIRSFTTSNRAPQAASDVFSDVASGAATTLDVLANDSDADTDALVIKEVTQGRHGTVSIAGDRVIYTPGSTFEGNDDFTYTVDDSFGGVATAEVSIQQVAEVATQLASQVRPAAAVLNGAIAPKGRETSVYFEYSTDLDFATPERSEAQLFDGAAGRTNFSAEIKSLRPLTRYYFRAVAESTAGVIKGSALTFYTPFITWAGAGADAGVGELDITRVLGTTVDPVVFTNVAGQGFDIVVSTSNLRGLGISTTYGAKGWWLQGTSSSEPAPATVKLQFLYTGTARPYPVSGVTFRFEDAERGESLRDFTYLNSRGVPTALSWKDTTFSYSHTPTFTSDTIVENGAPVEGLSQSGKWVGVDLSAQTISGFAFALKRQTTAAGSVILGTIGADNTLQVSGAFAPLRVLTGVDSYASVPDYTSQLHVSGGGAVEITQTPAPGTRVQLGVTEIVLVASDDAGHTATTGFSLAVADGTAPRIEEPAGGFSGLTLEATQALPDYAAQAIVSDNSGSVKVTQMPKAGSIATVGTIRVVITATDAAGNATTKSLDAVAEDVTGKVAAIMATASSVPGAGVPGSGVARLATFSSFGVPAIAADGAVAFLGNWTQANVRKSGVFAGTPPQLVIAQGASAPGVDGAIFTSFSDPALNRNGRPGSVGFRATVQTVAGAPALPLGANTGLWTDANGNLVLIARTGTEAPGTNGAIFKSFTAFTLVENEMLFTAVLVAPTRVVPGAPGGVTAANDIGLWRWTAETGVQLVFREGQKLPTASGEKTVSVFQMLGTIAGSAGHGRHHLGYGSYQVRVTMTDLAVANYLIDFTGAEPVFQSIVESGQTIFPKLITSSVGAPSGNAYGEAAFRKTFSRSATVKASNDTGLVASRNGAWEMIARKGDPVVEGTTWLTFDDPVMNEDGDVAWVGTLAGCEAACNTVVAWSPLGGDPQLVARKGTPAPGTDGAVFDIFNTHALPEGGRGPLFTATLLAKTPSGIAGKPAVAPGPGGVTTANDTGLWGVDNQGELRLLVREGQKIGNRTVKAFTVMDNVVGSPAQTRSFNARGQIILRVTFSDGTQSVVTVRIP